MTAITPRFAIVLVLGIAPWPIMSALTQEKIGSAEALTATSFSEYQKQIKPQPGESRWLDVPWFLDLHAARQKAAAEGKPLLIYSSGGSVSIGAC